MSQQDHDHGIFVGGRHGIHLHGTRPVATWVVVSSSNSVTCWSGARPGVRVISVPNTVGIPTARAASAKRTTP